MKTIKSIVFFFSGLLSVAVLFELLLSLGGILVPIVHIDKEHGERYFPNKLCCSLFVGEGFGLARTNSSGWFGKDFYDKGSSDVSIAVMGNSFVASRQIFYRDNFLTIAENSINKKLSDKTASFYDFGKEAMPLSELLYIKEEIATTYNPDYIIVLINAGSFSTSNRLVPYYELGGDSLRLNLSFKESSTVKLYSKLQLLTKSSLFFLAYRVKNKLPQLWQILLDKFYFQANEPKSSVTSVNSDIAKSNEYSINAIDKAVIERLDKDKKVVFLLDLDSVPSAKVKSLITQAHIIDLEPALWKLWNKQGINPYYWRIDEVEGHWNLRSHKVIGEEIAKSMANIIESK